MFNIFDNNLLVAEGLSEGETAQFLLDCYETNDPTQKNILEDLLYKDNFKFIHILADSKLTWRIQNYQFTFTKGEIQQ